MAEKDQCHGAWEDSTYKGWGPIFQYSCIHSGIIEKSSGVSTTYYNYVLASAGTIIDENTTSSNPADNAMSATDSICPKGWTLPYKAQLDSNRDIASFSPVLGGVYYNSLPYGENENGGWWGGTGYGARRYRLIYEGGRLYTGNSRRSYGSYIRCVQKST